MAQNKKQPNIPTSAMLTISQADFKSRLEKRIEIGEELKARKINSNNEYEKLTSDFNIWDDYNHEMLKQVFDVHKNEYSDSYDHAGFTFMGQMGEVQGNPIQTKKNLIDYRLNNLKSLLAKAELLKTSIPNTDGQKITLTTDNKQVFIVHGHNKEIQQSVARTIEKLGLKPIILHEQPNSGKTVIEKFEAYSNVGFAIILMTDDDAGKAKTENDLKKRARQNVILELGYFIGKLGRDKVLPLYVDGVELPSDIHGVVYVPIDQAENWKFSIVRELKAAGYSVDANKLL